MYFVGAFERNLDDKGRLALPATYRDHLGDHCYLVKGLDKSVSVIPSAVFEQEADFIDAREKAGEITRNEARAWFYSAKVASFDKQGRIIVDESLRSYAGLVPGEPVMIGGRKDRLEIWSNDRFARVDDEGTGRLAGADE